MSQESIFVFPGSFDPPTIGHLDIIKRAKNNCDILYVAVLNNQSKNSHMFSLEERLSFLEKMTQRMDGVIIKSFDGLLVDFCEQYGCQCIIKGVRNTVDFEYEMNMADINGHLSKNMIETVFLPSKKEYSFISSSLVRELIHFKADLSSFVTQEILDMIKGAIK